MNGEKITAWALFAFNIVFLGIAIADGNVVFTIVFGAFAALIGVAIHLNNKCGWE